MSFLLSHYTTPFKFNKPVLAPSGIEGSYDEMAVDSPFVFFHNNQYHMLHVGFDGIGYQTSIAHSNDLLHWEKGKPLFSRQNLEGWNKSGIAGVWILKENDIHGLPILKKWHGKYWMVYHSYPDPGYESGPANIGLAYTADETLQTWHCLPDPILRWQDGASWESFGLYKGCLIEHHDRFYLFYNAKDSQEWLWHEQIGIAISDDLLHWTRLSDQPVIKNTTDGWDSAFCADPYIVNDGSQWIMFYYGYNGKHAQEGIAYSDDLIHWSKHPAPLIECGSSGTLDELHAHKPCVIQKDGILYHFYCAVRPSLPSDCARNQDPTQLNQDIGEYRCISVATSKELSVS